MDKAGRGGAGRRRAEPEHYRRKLETVLQSIVDGVYTTDPSRRITFWNKAAERITGFRPEDVLGKTCEEVLCHRDEDGKSLCPDSCPIAETMSSRDPIFGKDVFSGSAWGSPVPVSVSCSPIMDDEGNVLGAIEVFRDIADRKRLERQKAEFYSMVTHDLKAPLQAIMGYAELLAQMKDEDLNDNAREFGSAILQNVDSLNRMINDFLTVSKMGSGVKPSLTDSSLAALLRGIHSNFKHAAATRGVTMYLQAGDAPSFPFDAELVGRAVSNLVTNALKFTPRGGAVTISARTAGGQAEVSVSDTGPGIPSEELPRVFDLYYRAEGASGREGSGLGLAIVKALAEAHGGHVRAESAPGKGSAFTITLPLAPRGAGPR